MSGPGETKEGFLEVRCQCHTEAWQPGAAGAPQGRSGHGRLKGDCFSAACVVAVGPPQAEEPSALQATGWGRSPAEKHAKGPSHHLWTEPHNYPRGRSAGAQGHGQCPRHSDPSSGGLPCLSCQGAAAWPHLAVQAHLNCADVPRVRVDTEELGAALLQNGVYRRAALSVSGSSASVASALVT